MKIFRVNLGSLSWNEAHFGQHELKFQILFAMLFVNKGCPSFVLLLIGLKYRHTFEGFGSFCPIRWLNDYINRWRFVSSLKLITDFTSQVLLKIKI